MATATSKATGWALRCPHCGEGEVLAVMLDGLAVKCTACDEEVTRHDLALLIEDARRLLRWLDAAATV